MLKLYARAHFIHRLTKLQVKHILSSNAFIESLIELFHLSQQLYYCILTKIQATLFTHFCEEEGGMNGMAYLKP